MQLNFYLIIHSVVDCGRPPVIPNGRGYLVNGTTFYGSIVEYHCLPDFRMISESQHRVCQANGEWLVCGNMKPIAKLIVLLVHL